MWYIAKALGGQRGEDRIEDKIRWRWGDVVETREAVREVVGTRREGVGGSETE